MREIPTDRWIHSRIIRLKCSGMTNGGMIEEYFRIWSSCARNCKTFKFREKDYELVVGHRKKNMLAVNWD